ncbi:NitT/TauT family transport system ATP-binding protein [Actinomyces denticolens]|uniref:NitT/TauT family transport system ATP-binding protein n=1 Tax=Actinomyces denticolens TaxID=52767 RepID=A0ABY1ICC6_9ACTO|nr:ABC transporter ATP-binding protein [Actinomyces denticolens]SHI94636.1 NitT/TauT family transport system ATP-binding protein [Actinomyces denticolens]
MTKSTTRAAAVADAESASEPEGAPAGDAGRPRGAEVVLDGVTHRYPLHHELDHGWLSWMIRRVSPAARARHEAEAAKGSSLQVLDDVALTIPPGQFVAVVGQSGCGKSTILRLLAGLEAPTRGSVVVDGERIARPAPERAMAFQDATLLPWRTVRDNVALGPQARGRLAIDQRRIDAALEIVGLREFAGAYPSTLSGGMAQRAALARALVNRPRLFLLDEPFGKLDALTRLGLQDEFAHLWSSQGFTAILVTHDVDEALRLAERVVVLSERPAHVVADLEVPRALAAAPASADYQDLKARILSLLGR